MPKSRKSTGGLLRGNLFDTNIKATSIDEDIFTDQELLDETANDSDLILVLDVSESPDKIKYITRNNLIGSGLVTINNNTDNYIVTATGSDLNGEANLTFDGTILVNDGGEINLDISSGDPHMSFQIGGSDKFTIGVDDSDSDNFKIDSGSTVGASTLITLDGSGNTIIAGDLTVSGDDLTMGTNTSGYVLVADGTNYNPVAISGDITLAANGAVAIGSGVIVDADINASAAIALSKTALTAGTNISLSTNTLNVDDAFLVNDGDDATTGTITSAGLIVDGNKNVTPGDGAFMHLDTATVTDTNTSGSGTAAKYTHVNIEAPTLAATNSSVTTSDAATLYINAATTAGSNQTITRNWAMWVDAGNARFDGSIYSGTTHAINSSGVLQVANQSNITGVGTIATGVWEGTAIASAYIAGDAITGAKIADDAIDSEHYTDGSIDTAHIAASQVTHAKLADDIVSGQDEITTGFAAADELMYSDDGVIKRVGLDTMATKLFSVASAGTVAQASDHMLFLDGGATGDVIVESIDDFLSAIAGSGISVSSSQLTSSAGAVTAINNATANELVTIGSTTTELDAETALTFDGSDLKLLEAVNNGNPSVSVGGADAERLIIQSVFDSGAQTLDYVEFATAAASSSSNKGKFVFDVDGTDILDIDDSGINLASGKTFRINGSEISSAVITALNNATANELVTVGSTTTELDAEANLTYASDVLTTTSSSANLPRLDIINTHADATAGMIKFVKDPGSGQGADNDIMGTITWYGTDAGNNAAEELARMEAYVIEADHGSEAGGIKFYVAENDATMTAGLQVLGVKDADGEIDVTIGAGAASTTTIAGTLTMGSTAAMTNAGLLSVADQSNITGLGTISSGTWEATDVAVAHGGTGASTLTANAVLTGNGTSAIQAESDLLFASNQLIPTASAHDAAGTALTISAGATTAGTSNNQAGGALTFEGGQGKGSGAGGDIVFKTANAGGSGSSLNSLATALTLSDDLSSTFVGDMNVIRDANNADVKLTLGTSAAESLIIQVLNGGSNKTAEEVHFSTATASGTGDHGKMVFDVDGTDIATIDDGGIDLASGKTFAINGTDIVSSPITALNSATANELVTVGSTTTELDAEANLTFASDVLTLASSTADLPRIDITNTHAGATAGKIRFNKDSASGADSDVMGTIEWFGTDDSDNTHELLASMEAYIIEADHGSEAAGIKFKVAENDATMTSGLEVLGVKDADGEIDVNIGAGAASTTTIKGTLTMGSTAALTNAGLVAVADQSNITGLGTISSGVWEGTDVGVAHGGTGASTLTANGVLIGNGTSAITSVDMTTKGHILIGDGSGNPRMLAIGDDDQVLTADSGETTGVKWAAASGGASQATATALSIIF